MGLFKKGNTSTPVKTYSREELFRKEKTKELMTYDEIQALNREKSKDLTNQVLRVLGLVTALVLVILAVGCFLYPFSFLNFIPTKGNWGMNGDTFWALTSRFPVFSHGEWHVISEVIESVLRNEPYTPGFIDVFYFISFWTIPVIATVGLVSIVVYAAYIVAYNIKDLVNVIKHFFNRAGYVVADVVDAGKESFNADEKNKKKKSSKKTVKKLPDEIKETINDISTPVLDNNRREESIGGYSTEELDALLRGEALPEKKDETGTKSIF